MFDSWITLCIAQIKGDIESLETHAQGLQRRIETNEKFSYIEKLEKHELAENCRDVQIGKDSSKEQSPRVA